MSKRGARLARDLPRRLLEAVRVGGLWSPGARVALAVSGGVDSRVLMQALAETRAAHGADLLVLSVNHGLRPEAAAEVAAVLAAAADLGLPAQGLAVQVEAGPDLSARARDARRAALRAAAGPGALIATAHHADDQAETVLQRLFAGSGSAGLAALRPRAGGFVRPMLDEDRDSIVAFAELRGIDWAEDPSNPASERGRLRRTLAEQLGRGPRRALARSARLLAREDDLLEQLASEALPGLTAPDGALDHAGLRALHPALAARALRQWLGAPPPRADELERALALSRPGAAVAVGGGRALRLAGGWLRLQAAGPDLGPSDAGVELQAEIGPRRSGRPSTSS
jgi:tRNA(Ile)-lysidine synthase